MNLQRFARSIIIATLLVIAFGMLQTSSSVPSTQAQQAPFLITPYYGTKNINSFFDHEFPTQIANGSIVVYTGDRRAPAGINNCVLGFSCYDGHEGIDFAIQYEHIISAAEGDVINAGWADGNCRGCGLGLRIEIQHSNGYRTLYGHLSAIAVQPGQHVQAGEVIGTSGNTGFSTGPHFHFELRNVALRRVDPFGWSGGFPDPWAQQPNGAISLCLWKDGEWANICGGIRRLIPEPVNGGEFVVDDTTNNTGGFSKGRGGPFNNVCPPAACNFWYSVAAGYLNDMYYTFVNGNVADYWAKWQASVPANGGIYEVFVHVPNVNATTWQARYVIRYNQNTLQTTALVDQAGLFNQWVSLGTYYMTNNDYVYTTDATGEFQGDHCGAGQYCRLGVDAVKFVRRGTTYLPYTTTSGWTSSVTVHNNGGGPAKVYVAIFDSNGSLQCSAFPVPDVPAHGNETFALTSTSCPPAAAGRVDASQNVAVVVENRSGALGYAYTGQTSPATTLHLPQALGNPSSVWHTNIRALNTGSSPTNITTNFYNPDGSVPSGGTSTLPNVAANGSGEVTQSLPSSYWGAARMTANQPIAAVVRVSDSSAHRRLGYTGVPVAASTVWLPFVMTRLGNDWGATIWVQNTTAVNSTVTVDFFQEGSSSVYRTTGAVSLPANGLAVFNLRTTYYGLGEGWYGSARVTAGAPVAVVVNQLNDTWIDGATYEGIPASAGSTMVVLPYVARRNGCYSSNFTVRNLGSNTATVTINYYEADGRLALSVPNQSVVSHKLYNLHTAPPAGLPNPFSGSVGIVSTNNRPIAATSNMLDYLCGPNGPNDTISYTGVNR